MLYVLLDFAIYCLILTYINFPVTSLSINLWRINAKARLDYNVSNGLSSKIGIPLLDCSIVRQEVYEFLILNVNTDGGYK